ncbi:MAG: metal-dependent hydrolase [Verrucomicrobiota bacterium]
MDPLTQASLGAAAAVAFSKREHLRLAAVVGAAAGMAPDIDVLIKSAEDPLLSLQYHRHFTHALIFAPLLGLVVAGLFRLLLYRKRPEFSLLAKSAVIGALTHGPLDACTSYGTLLYWPFVMHRESWDIISIIDPVFTGPLVALLLFAVLRKRRFYGRLALALCLIYLCLGCVQRERAKHVTEQLVAERGHTFDELTARPSLANIVLWRIIYRQEDHYYVQAVHLSLFGGHKIYEGNRVAAFQETDAASLAPDDSTLAGDIARFRYFSQGYLYLHSGASDVIGDLRYSAFPNSVIPLWGIRFDSELPDKHGELEYFRTVSEGDIARLWSMILGR